MTPGGSRSPKTGRTVCQTRLIGPEVSPYGVYEVLSNSTDALVRQPLPLIDSLRMTRRPHLTAYLYRFLLGLVASFLIAYVITQSRQTARYASGASNTPFATLPHLLLWGVAASLIIVGWLIAVACTTEYSVDKGRLQVVTGILVRKRTNLELYRVQNVTLTRNLIQRLTNDGTLVLDSQPRTKSPPRRTCQR